MSTVPVSRSCRVCIQPRQIRDGNRGQALVSNSFSCGSLLRLRPLAAQTIEARAPISDFYVAETQTVCSQAGPPSESEERIPPPCQKVPSARPLPGVLMLTFLGRYELRYATLHATLR